MEATEQELVAIAENNQREIEILESEFLGEAEWEQHSPMSLENDAAASFDDSGIQQTVHDAETEGNTEPEDTPASRADLAVAAASGLLTASLNVLWQEDFDLEAAHSLGAQGLNKFVIRIARSQGLEGEKPTLKQAIVFLEQNFPMAGDKLTNQFGGGLQHHLRDFTHHPSPVGLIFSIASQFTGQGFGVDTAGKFIHPQLPSDALIGNSFEEKIALGTVRWFFHLASDMAGSSSNPGVGTGIPGPILSMAKELSTLPLFQDAHVSRDGEPIELSRALSKMFNGTWVKASDGSPLKFDLRTEIGLAGQALTQARSVVANECIVRAYYLCSRLPRELQRLTQSPDAGLTDLNPESFLPYNNRALNRMLTVSSGVFVLVNAAIAGVSTTRKHGASPASVPTFLLKINIVGLGRLAFALRADRHYIAQDALAWYKSLLAPKLDNEDALFFNLDPEHIRLLFSLQAAALEEDIRSTKLSPMLERKRAWADQWRKEVDSRYGSDYLLDEQTAAEVVGARADEGILNPNDLAMITTLQQFQPYAPASRRTPRVPVSFDKSTLFKVVERGGISTDQLERIAKAWRSHGTTLEAKRAKIAAGGTVAIAATVATAGTATAFAPEIAVFLAGDAVTGLSGAALTSAGLAWVGGGSLAAGGLGMAGGTTIIASGGALLGLAGGGSAASAAVWLSNSDGRVLDECRTLLVVCELIVTDYPEASVILTRARTSVLQAINTLQDEDAKAKGNPVSSAARTRRKNLRILKRCSKRLEKLLAKTDSSLLTS